MRNERGGGGGSGPRVTVFLLHPAATDGVGVTGLGGGRSCHNSMSHVFRVYLVLFYQFLSKACCIRYGVGRNQCCWDDDCEEKEDARTQANEHDCYCIIKVEAAATGPHDATMQLQAAERCSPGCRGARSYRLIRPISRQSGAHGPGSLG